MLKFIKRLILRKLPPRELLQPRTEGKYRPLTKWERLANKDRLCMERLKLEGKING